QTPPRYSPSLHDALPISRDREADRPAGGSVHNRFGRRLPSSSGWSALVAERGDIGDIRTFQQIDKVCTGMIAEVDMARSVERLLDGDGAKPGGAGSEPDDRNVRHHFAALSAELPRLRTAMKASCGISTEPTIFMRALPSFCFSSSLRFRLTSPP